MRACPPPGRGRGTGPDGDKFRRGGTQETLGGAEAKRSPEEGLCPVLAKRPDIKKKPAKNLFLVGLFFFQGRHPSGRLLEKPAPAKASVIDTKEGHLPQT